MSFGESIAPFLGRLVLAWFFITQAYRYARDWNATALLLTMKDLPAPPFLMLVGLVCAAVGSMSLLLGLRTRIGALLLFAITLGVAVTLHDYWHIKAAVARNADFDIFARDIAIAGGLLVLTGLGAGKFAMDNAGSKTGGRSGGARHH
jgi:putative oxidoreductase